MPIPLFLTTAKTGGGGLVPWGPMGNGHIGTPFEQTDMTENITITYNFVGGR